LSASTAFVHIGQPHQNDVALYPEYLLRLEEGHIARWIIQSLSADKQITVIEPKSPSEIGPSLVDFIAQLVSQSHHRISVVVAALEGSSLNEHLEQISLVSDCDIHILTTAFSSVHSVWTGKTHIANHHHFGNYS
jgi:hypothetical protein